jgi:vancomycin permeability regulator SanA
MNKKSKIFSYPAIIFIVLLNLLFLFLIKYQNQNLPISNFSFSSFGNLCNLFFALILIIGILVLVFKRDVAFETKKILPIFIINQLLIITIYILKIISLPYKKIYYFGQTGDELLVGGIFVLYIFTYLLLIYIVWQNIFKVKNLIIIRAFFNSSISMIAILVIVFFFIVAKEASFNDELIEKGKMNTGVVLGAAVWSGNKPSPSLAGRVDKALALYEENKISQIYLTGSNAPGELAEAEVALQYIKLKGINTSQVFIEKETTSTNGQIQFIKQLINTKSNKNIIVISDAYHLVRVLEIAKFHKLKVFVSASALSQSFEKALYNNIRESIALTVFWFFAI